MEIKIEVPDDLKAMTVCFFTNCKEGFKLSNEIYDSNDIAKMKFESEGKQ